MLLVVIISRSAIVVFVLILSRDRWCKSKTFLISISTNTINKLLHGWFLCTILILSGFEESLTHSPLSRSFVCDSSQLVNKNRTHSRTMK